MQQTHHKQQQTLKHLGEEHRRTEKLLQALEPLLDDVTPDMFDRCRCKDVVTRLCDAWPFMERHMAKEELLFEVLEEFLPSDHGPLDVLRSEHIEVFQNFSRMRESARLDDQGVPHCRKDCLWFAKTTARIIRDHMYKEDRVLFPLVSRFLPPETDLSLVARMKEMDRDMAAGSRE